ncbi:MAG: NADH-quinone oxidoreductase subunit A [Candidatus Caenarcaniphilales bacterium]|jgi:NADH:ubiquinone oxidoreductase subunit 3 (subunit A)|nr:NADH-quinone oxidoreductase subunit A [Candidatus Caenarcaniphilales bacterium]
MTTAQIGLITALALVNGLVLLGLSTVIQRFFGIYNPGGMKNETYECGMKSEMNAQVQFDIKYYLFAIIFIVFDVEFVFLMPWANLFNAAAPGTRGFIIFEAFIFVGILAIGLIYAWRKGALNWHQE